MIFWQGCKKERKVKNAVKWSKFFKIDSYFAVFLEPPHDPIDDIEETAIPKKSTSRKKRRPKLSTKKEVDEVEIEHSTNYFNDEDPEFFPDPNLRLALQSLRVMSHDCKNIYR